ncbi:PspA/IM30 family protein [Muribacter muris]|uniref:PspA/IM30 family protein n=1 Tax=Muribacter muris TaxID=67855 RepID=A0A4Y9K274_9PAST|nr:PspA/IM30 family protein [Muribacter muris]MBF0784693.1 PspA/IM30 family protein [Muribacter muris]MBF0827860.1 PspA/IM30 family protein [Muribacter muris]TFV11120.1 PspA/IM30 family protein [Muribacter muris]
MSETLARRVGRLISGGFHAVIDAAENLAPEAVMNENIREVEQAIESVRSELGKVLVQKHLTTKKLLDENNRHTLLADTIQTALKAGRDDLAETGIAEQMDIEARLPILENSLSDCATQEKELERFIVALQAKRREMQNAIQEWKQSQKQAVTHEAISANKLNQINRETERSHNAFERILKRQTGMGLNPSDTAQLAKLKELEELNRSQQIKARLAQLKAADMI